MTKKLTKEEFEKAISITFDSDAGNNLTIKGYLKELLSTIWAEGESFSGKRPFGNSGWKYDLYAPLVKSGLVKGELDEDGYVQEIDTDAAYDMVNEIIEYIFK